MPKRSDDYMADRREEILRALLRCVEQSGWTATTIDDVAREAGLSKGAVYTHFRNKAALLQGLLDRGMAETARSYAEVTDKASFRRLLADHVACVCTGDAPRLAAGHMEAMLDGVRQPEFRKRIDLAMRHMLDMNCATIARLNPALSPAEQKRKAATLLLLVEGMRSYRISTDVFMQEDIRQLVDRLVDEI